MGSKKLDNPQYRGLRPNGPGESPFVGNSELARAAQKKAEESKRLKKHKQKVLEESMQEVKDTLGITGDVDLESYEFLKYLRNKAMSEGDVDLVIDLSKAMLPYEKPKLTSTEAKIETNRISEFSDEELEAIAQEISQKNDNK